MQTTLGFIFLCALLTALSPTARSSTCQLSNSTNCNSCGTGSSVCCYKIRENLEPGVVFGNARQIPTQDVAQYYNNTEEPVLSLTNSNHIANVTSNGTFYTLKSLDSDTDMNCVIVHFTISNNGASNNFFIAVEILDVNDNAPRFQESSPVNVTVSETNAKQEICRSAFLATDEDDGQNSNISYSVISPSSFWASINTQTGKPCINSHIPIDRESNDSFTLLLQAIDHGNPPLNSTLTIHLYITDINDNVPMFLNSPQSPSVLENATIGTPVVTYIAIDRDVDDTITYTLEPDYSSFSGSIFPFILKSTRTNCTILVNSTLDVDGNSPNSNFRYTITASDGSQESTLTDTISVLPVNDNPPQIDSVVINNTITEGCINASSNFVVQPIVISDRDGTSNINGEILNGSEYFSIIRPFPNAKLLYYIMYNQNGFCIDREETPVIYLLLSFSDGEKSTNITLTFTVLDINDNPPFLSQTNFTIMENFQVGVNAIFLDDYFKDPDNGSNGTLKEFVDISQNYFLTVHRTGVIEVVHSLDREKGNYLTIIVNVSDNGVPSLTSTEILHIWITDANDNCPMFVGLPANLTFTVQENLPPNHFIGQVRATDADTGNNSAITYRLLHTNEFNITTNSGNLSSVISFDREKEDVYRVVVVATDRGDPPLSSNVTLNIKILDVNDNIPVFNQSGYNFTTVSTSVGTVVGMVSATDRDIGQNAIILYDIFNSTSYFNIMPGGGVYISNPLAGGNITTYRFIVYCFNPNMSYSNSSSAWVEVNISPGNEDSIILLYAVSIGGGGLLVAVLAIILFSCCIWCCCYCRRLHRSKDLFIKQNQTDLGTPPLKPSIRAGTSSNANVRYEDTNGVSFKGIVMAKSPMVNFSSESELRFYNRDQSLKKAESTTYKVQTTEDFEMKSIEDKLESPPTKEETKVSSLCLSEDLSSSPSISADLSHFYNQHTNQHSAPPVLREELLKKHDREYAINNSIGRYPSAVVEEPMDHDDESVFGISNHLPPILHNLLAHNHMISNQSISAPVSHYVSQTDSTVDSNTSQFGERGMNHAPPPPPPIGHLHHGSVPAVYKNGGTHHRIGSSSRPPVSPRNMYTDVFYDQHMDMIVPPPIHMNGTSLTRYSSSSSSSHHTPSDYPYSAHHRSLSRELHEHNMLHNGGSTGGIQQHHLPPTIESPYRHHRHAPPPPHHSHTHVGGPHSAYQPHPLIQAQDKLQHVSGPIGPIHNYQSSSSDDDTESVASSVLDKYLQFNLPPLKHDFLSLSVDDIKLSSAAESDLRRIKHNHYAS